MKTPDEFKKNLIACMDEAIEVAENGDAHDLLDLAHHAHARMSETLTYIQQLEAELADAKRNHQHTIDIAEKQKEQIGKLKKLVVRLYKEKKAAIRDCSEFPCNTCENNNPHFYSPFCRDCIKAGSTRRTNHEWRGVCPDTEV